MSVITWQTALSEIDQDRIRAVLDAATAHDGISAVGDQVLRELGHDRTRHLLAKDGDEVLGYLDLVPATPDAPAMAEVAVHPDARRRGVGSDLIRVGLAEGGVGARVWAHGNLEPAKAVAASLGLVVVRQLLQMRRPLRDLPQAIVSDGVRIRTYEGPGDDAELLRVNNAAFAWHPEQGGWADADIAQRRGEAWFDPEGFFLAFDEQSHALLGFHWTKFHRLASGEGSNRPALGEVYVVGVDPEAQGRGLGATLTLVGLHHLAARLGPSADVMLYVEADNSAAVKTYERLAFEIFGADVAYTPR